MLKRNRKKPKRGNTILLTLYKKQGADNGWCLFCCPYVAYIQQNVTTLYSEIKVVDRIKKVACFDLKIEHVKFHRNKEKNSVLDH
ncbi:hypothetical protein LCGC14_1308530 [marine sediment metagenome]|uniref:Uncharacterized protein n=1 Tax=marine sediment metagenome TaxID=412755 RepID=A0A0F9N465_9ZZZZ